MKNLKISVAKKFEKFRYQKNLKISVINNFEFLLKMEFIQIEDSQTLIEQHRIFKVLELKLTSSTS